MKNLICRTVSITCATPGRRIRVAPVASAATAKKGGRVLQLTPGAALVQVCTPQPILGYWFRRDGHLTVYVAGTMAPALRTAVEQRLTTEEMWLDAVPAGIQEIDLTDCRPEFRVLLPAEGHAQAA